MSDPQDPQGPGLLLRGPGVWNSDTDTTPGNLNQKLVAGDDIQFIENGIGGNESCTINNIRKFGKEYDSNVVATQNTTVDNNDIIQNVYTFTTTAGEFYRFQWSVEWLLTSSGKGIQIEVNGFSNLVTPEQWQFVQPDHGSASQWMPPLTGFFTRQVNAPSIEVEIRFRRSSNKNVALRNSRLEMWRIP